MPSISLDEFLLAFKDYGGYCEWYLDRESGECVMISDDLDPEEESTIDIHAQMAENPERFLAITPLESRKSYRLMERFIAGVEQKDAAEVLGRAIAGKRAFFNFKDRLHDYPELRQAWFVFEQQELKELAEVWLEMEEVEVVWRER